MKPLEWFPYNIIGSKTIKTVRLDPQTTDVWPGNRSVV